jgi:CBS domain-containing protein
VANIEIDRIDGLRAEDVMHAQTSALAPQTTVAEARAYFAASSSRRLAVVAENGRYLAALTRADLGGDGDPDRRAVEVAGVRATVDPEAPAAVARDLAMATETRRVPVVAGDGRYLGIVSLNSGLEWFCGTG